MDFLILSETSQIPVRIYRPNHAAANGGAVLFIHGGGFTVGSIRCYDAFCRDLAHEANLIVASVGYRLAPEYPFPSGLKDCYSALVWIVEHAEELGIDARRLAIVGDSAGGNLAVATSLIARDSRFVGVSYQLLLYPCLDLTLSGDTWIQFGTGYWLETPTMRWFVDCYTDGEIANWPLVSPLFADLRGLPSTYIMVPEFDPLRQDGERFAAQLSAVGVPVVLSELSGLIHGVATLKEAVPRAVDVIQEAALALRLALS
jgi:acetyl esterase